MEVLQHCYLTHCPTLQDWLSSSQKSLGTSMVRLALQAVMNKVTKTIENSISNS